MSLTSSLNMATNALSVAQSAISVISNNISNVDNKNYSKLSVHLTDSVNGVHTTSNPTGIADSLTGVDLSSIDRASNEYLEGYSRSENSKLNYYSTSQSISTAVEDVTNELNSTSSGLSSALSKYYTAVTSLSDNPSDTSLRTSFLSAAKTVCEYFNTSYTSLTNTEQELVGDYTMNGSCVNSEIGTDVDTVNSLFEQLANINNSIVKTNSETTSNSSLLDTRNQVLSEISQYTNINTTINNDGTATVAIGNYTVVSGSDVEGYLQVATGSGASEPVTVNLVKDPKLTAPSNIIHSDIGDSISSGTMGAILDATCSSRGADFTISGVIDSLNTLANSFSSTMNSLQKGSQTVDGNTTYAMCLDSTYTKTQESEDSLFVNNTITSPTATDADKTVNINAGNISVNTEISSNLNLIAAARTSVNTSTADIGNNSNLTSITNTKSTTYKVLGNQTYTDYIASTNTDIGTQVSSFKSNQSSTSTVLSSITSKISSEVGVNLDEELSNLIQFQQMYQASAQVFSTCNSLLQTLMQMGK